MMRSSQYWSHYVLLVTYMHPKWPTIMTLYWSSYVRHVEHVKGVLLYNDKYVTPLSHFLPTCVYAIYSTYGYPLCTTMLALL